MAKPKKPASTKKKPTPEEVKAKADRAEKRSAKAATNTAKDDEDKALFLQTLPKIADLKAKVATATANLRNAYKTAKKDGFTKDDFETAFKMQGAEGEKAKKAAIARDLTIAKWLGCDLGAQLDLFVQDERVPAEDRAYSEGQAASMKGETAKPDYHPSTPQHAAYMKGFHDDQEKRVKGGIKKLHPEVAKDQAEVAEKNAKVNGQKAEDAKAFEQPTSGTPVTRSQFNEMNTTKPN